jgi:energy-coupling factor transport system substrate-specific component
MQDFFASIFNAISFGPLRWILIAISLVTIAAAIVTMLLEIAGRRLTRKGIVKTGLKWDATNIAIAAICGAIYTGARFLQTPQIVPGFGGLTFTHVLAPVIALLLGIPGAVGVALSVPFGDFIFGYLSIGSLSGVSGHWMALCYIPYLMVQDPSFRNRKSIIAVYFWAILIGSFWHSITIDGWLDVLALAPTEVCWGVIAPGVVVAHGVLPAILIPFVLTPLFPAVKAMGLYWKDRATTVVSEA